VIRVHTLANGALRTGEGSEAIPDAPGPSERFWVEAVEPSPEETIALSLGLGLHDLALEDALSEGHPPKLEDFGSHLFLIAHTPDPKAPGVTRKVSLFLSKTWIVTVERVPVEGFGVVRDRVQRDPTRFLGAPERLAHAILDFLAEGFEGLTDRLVDRTEELEEAVLEDGRPKVLTEILQVRRQVTEEVRVVRDQRDAVASLVRTADERFGPEMLPYLRDVQDHLNRVLAQMESVLQGLSGVRDAYQSQVNNRLSDTMRVLTVLTTVMMPLQLVTGIFGMNFVHIPGLSSEAAFWGALVAMGLIAGTMIWLFRRRGWL
jgi:magnesium transporter